MKIETLDHVAIWAGDRDELSVFLTAHVGMHVIERTDRFTLVGSDPRRGKLTLFAAEGDREPGALLRVGLGVSDLDDAARRLPAGLELHCDDDSVGFQAPGGLAVALVERADGGVDYDIDHVALRVRDTGAVYAGLSKLGFRASGGRLAAGDSSIELVAGDPGEPERPLLNHLGLRVRSAAEHIAEARKLGLEIADIVDAPNTYAVFVWGPERIKLEYVEHKASFALA